MKAVIVGCGVGGVATAARLARAGIQVIVLEKNDFNGGRCSLLYQDGYRFDRGPSFYLMPKTFEETFDDLGEDIHEWIDLRKCPTNYIVHYHDGKTLELSTDLTRMREQLERFEPGSFEHYLRFMKEAHIHYDMSVNMVLKNNFETIWQLLTLNNLVKAFKLHVLNKVYSRACKYFRSDRLRRAFTFQSMYMGMSPFDAPATYNLLQYTELAEGIWYPIGGFNTVVQSLEKIAKKHGADFRYNSEVKRIVTEGKVTKGCELTDGTFVEADIVICNADLLYAYNELLPESSYGKSLDKKNLTSSSISFYWGLDRKVEGLNAHNIFLAEHYRESFDDIFKKLSLPKDPSFYVNVPSRIDKTAAPDGKDAVVVLVPVGWISDAKGPQDWPLMIARARAFVLETLSRQLGIEDFGSLITTERVSTPHDWAADFNLYKGAILGLSHDILQVLWFRPGTKHATLKNLYFVGASTQPGTGVPIVMCGAKLTATQILRDYKVAAPPSRSAVESGQVASPNEKHLPPPQLSALDILRERQSTLANFFFLLVILAFITSASLLPRFVDLPQVGFLPRLK
ncbi:hypothetical protein PYCC9005_005072 [Savitreella phatthalungensis]